MFWFMSVFLAVGFGLLSYAAISAWRSTAAANWPVTAGTIRTCKVETKSDGDGSTYQVKVSYDYTVNGRPFTGDRIAYGYTATNAIKDHDALCQRLNDASAIDVRYNPADPAVSTLSFGLHKSIRLIFAFAITWLAFSVGMAMLFWISQQSDNVLLKNLSTR